MSSRRTVVLGRSSDLPYVDRVLVYSPIQYYRFNEPSPETTIIDYSGLANNGTYSSGGTRQDKLAPTGVLVNSFDGVTDLAEGGLFTDPVANEPFFTAGSFAVWVQIISIPGAGEEYWYRHKRGNIDLLGGIISDGHLYFDHVARTDFGVVVAGDWHHVGCCWDTNDTRWFFDGVKVNTQAGFTFADGGYSAYSFAYAAGAYANVAFAEMASFKSKLSDAAFLDLATA